MAYTYKTTKTFERDLKRCKKRGYNLQLIKDAISALIEHGSLPSHYHPHKLVGDQKGRWECHIKPDWLMIWEQNDNEFTLLMLETGTHSDLFGKLKR